MQPVDDNALLRQYAESNSDEAFATLVTRHINLVYSVALRYVDDPHDAEEITQVVFIIFAKKAARLYEVKALSSWLFQVTRLTANNFVRSESRRHRREQEAHMQSVLNEPETRVWPKIAPLLDTAVAGLREKDRQAIVLRFYEGRNLREVGLVLGASEDAAEKRVSRALGKLRKFFTKRGVISTTAVIAGAISAHSVQAAPVALAKSVTAMAIAQGATASISTLTLIKGVLKIMAWTKAKTAIVVGLGVLFVAGTATVTVKKIEAHQLDEWRFQNIQSSQVDKASPQVRILPTKFSPPYFTIKSGSGFNKFVGIRASVADIAGKAYGFPRGRIHFTTEQPPELYDFVATLPQGSREALQRELIKKLGFVGHRETNDMEVLVLTLKRPNAPGLMSPVPGKPDDYWNPGRFQCFDQPIYTDQPPFQGLAHFLENYFGTPVVDQTGLSQHFSIDLKWKHQAGSPAASYEAIKKALLDQLGLELVPGRGPVETLVVEKAR